MATADPPLLPSVTVLLATFNGMRWLKDQLSSILGQGGVELRVIALDDESTDGTYEWLLEQQAADNRLIVSPRRGSSGGSAANFYRLIEAAPMDSDYYAFADQDDVWHPNKLARHAELIRRGGFDGVSSNVTSFKESGRRTLVRKNYPQRALDFLLESPGPGCSFLITPRLLALTAETLKNTNAREVGFHDSLIYAICRAAGWTWHIDEVISVDYRQHADNVMGANVGLRQGMARLRLIRSRWLRDHSTRLARVALAVAPSESRDSLERMLVLFESTNIRDRWKLARMSPQLRRRPRDQWIIGLLIAIGVW